MTGSFTYMPKEADLLIAMRMHYNRFQIKRIAYYMAFCSLVGAVLVVVLGDTNPSNILKIFGAIILYGLAIIVILQFFVRILWLPRYVRRVFKQQADFHHQIELEWDANQFSTQTPNADVRTPWKDFYRWDRSDNMLLLYRSEALFNFFPLNEPDQHAAADQIEEYLRKAAVKRRS